MRLDPINLYEYEARAQQVLPHDYWDFIAGGSKDELTTRRNRTAFDAISLRPRFLREVAERKQETTVLGTPISFPVMICPAGGHKIAHPEGECATACASSLRRPSRWADSIRSAPQDSRSKCSGIRARSSAWKSARKRTQPVFAVVVVVIDPPMGQTGGRAD